MSNPLQAFAMNLIENRMRQDPNFGKDENARHAIDILRSGDEKAGIELANNYLQSFGCSRDEGLQRAMQFFGVGGKR